MGCCWWVRRAVQARAQQRDERAPAESVGAELRLLASRAGVVFVGQVEKIEVKDGAAGEMGGGVVEITFSVEQPVLGVVGGSYVMREWAGRWTGGQQAFSGGTAGDVFSACAERGRVELGGGRDDGRGAGGADGCERAGAAGCALAGDEGAAGGGCSAGGCVWEAGISEGGDCAGGWGRGGEGLADGFGG